MDGVNSWVPIQAVFWLEWDSTALDAKAGFAACAARIGGCSINYVRRKGGRQGGRGLVAGRRREVQCGHCEQVRGMKRMPPKLVPKPEVTLLEYSAKPP